MAKRAMIIVLDSVGIGALPDAAEFGDAGAHTLAHTYSLSGGLDIPNLVALGIGNIEGAELPVSTAAPIAAYGKAAEVTKAKDTTCGHWEIAGLIMDKPFKTYPNGFPAELMRSFEAKIKRGTLGNVVASGTQIIQELGDEHVRTGKPIVYTSADSVFQIAAHEDVIPLEQLYEFCLEARKLLVGEFFVSRVIARPFTGADGEYTRTENRRDFVIPPVRDTILDGLAAKGIDTMGIGKIEDIFAHRGLTNVDHTKNNHTGIDAAVRFLKADTAGFAFVNLVDFDMLYGHRNDYEGYGRALEYFDARLPEITGAMRPDDILIITADHGCDPGYPGTDHTREYIPLLVTGAGILPLPLGIRHSFADVGATVYEYLTGSEWTVGESFLKKIYCRANG